MEENTVELFDYFRVIWKRKILIIVVTLVCIGIGVGVVVTNSMSKSLPVTLYQAGVVVKIGQKLKLTQSSGISDAAQYIESPGELKGIILRKYGLKGKDALEYHLDVKQIGSLSMLDLTLTGPDRGVGGVLKEIVDSLIDDHHIKAKAAIALYTGYINKLEADVQMFQENIVIAEATLKELKRRRGIHLENMVAAEAEQQKDKSGGGQSAFMNMLYLKTIDQERELNRNRRDLRNIQWQLILYQTSIGERDKYHTKMIGEIETTVITPKEKSTRNIIGIAGVAGLIMSLFIVFFMEYIEESKLRRKGK